MGWFEMGSVKTLTGLGEGFGYCEASVTVL